MSLPPETRNPRNENTKPNQSDDAIRLRRFASLESQLEWIPTVAGKIARKHWHEAEKEQYPFWIGIIVIALLGAFGTYYQFYRDVPWLAGIIAILMLVAIAVLVGWYLRTLQGRFQRQWASMSADGELFRFLRDAGVVLGHPVEMGRMDEKFSNRMEIPFPEAVRATETYLRKASLPDPIPPDAPAGLYVPALTLREPHGGETHRVYDISYRGNISRELSIRVQAVDAGSEITVGFAPRPARAETRDRIVEGLTGRLLDRFIAAKLICDIRETAGLDPVPIPALESGQAITGPAISEAM